MKTILLTSVLFICNLCFGQDTIINNEKFMTEFQSGFGSKVPMTFSLKKTDLEKIKLSPEYLKWEEKTFSNPKNADYIESNKNKTHIEMFLNGQTTMSSFFTKFKLKNMSSYTPLDGTSSMIYVSSDGGITISFNFQAQNGFGNMIYSTSITTIKLVNEELDYQTYVY